MNFTLLFGHEYVHENTRNVALKVAQKSIQKNEQRSQMYEQRRFFVLLLKIYVLQTTPRNEDVD